MKPLRLNFQIYQGQTFNEFIELDNPDGTNVDLTGYKARMQARYDINDSAPVFTWSTATGELVITPLIGRLAFNVPAAVTSALPNPQRERVVLFYDLELFLDSVSPEYVERLIEGTIAIYPEITR